jgi:TetR/AcrR family transcriptional regulator
MEQDVKTVILEAALELFSRRGFEGVGIQELVDRAGISKPTLYYHFGSKQGLLEALIRRHGEGLCGSCREQARYRHDLVMNLRGLFDAALDFARSQPRFWGLMLILFSSPQDSPAHGAGSALRGELLGILERLFGEAAADHGNMRGREELYGELFLGLLETGARLSLSQSGGLDPDRRRRIIHQFMHGIFS